MRKPCLNTASNLLEILEFSLLNATNLESSKLPMKGILEILSQIRTIVSDHTQVSNFSSETIPSGMFDNSALGLNGRSLSLELEVDRVADGVSSNGSQSVNYRPKVRTVPPEVRGRIRELVGIESEETF